MMHWREPATGRTGRHRGAGYLCSAVLVGLLFGIAFPAWSEQESGNPASIESGLQIARLHCARCHVIGDDNKFGGIGSTPSFPLLVRRRPDYLERFATFFSRRPHPIFVRIKGHSVPNAHLPPYATPIELPASAVDDLIAYAKSLAKQ